MRGARAAFGDLANANVSNRGTFSGRAAGQRRAAGQIGAVSVQKQVLDEVRKVATNTGRTADKIDGLMMEAE